MEKDEDKKKELKEKLGSEALPAYSESMEKALKANGGKYLVGNELTWADIAVASTIEEMGKWISEDWRTKSPELAAYVDRIFELPNIKKWIESRPKSDH
jgi:glutathione S-transferase